jgi:hypothetical protein
VERKFWYRYNNSTSIEGDFMAILEAIGSFGLIKDGIQGLAAGIGDLALKLRQAFTGEVQLTPDQKMAILLKTQEIEAGVQNAQNQLELTTAQVALEEAKSQDKWTSRARPAFLYVVYLFILFAIPMGILSIFSPVAAERIASGTSSWLKAIPESMWYLFGAGYLGYGAFRSFDKWNTMRDGR